MPDGTSLDFLAPLQTPIGIAPPAGRFWHAPTPSNSLLLTWQDVFLNRDTNYPATFQSELFAGGDFTFRYDFSTLNPQTPTLPTTNFVVGAQHNGGGETYAFGETNAVIDGLELRWRAFGLLDPDIDDHDGDGLSTCDEVMLHGSDPRLADSDLDGITDGDEVAAGSDPTLRDTDGDGLIDGSDPDPLIPTPPADLDGDGLPDAWEICRFGSTTFGTPRLLPSPTAPSIFRPSMPSSPRPPTPPCRATITPGRTTAGRGRSPATPCRTAASPRPPANGTSSRAARTPAGLP